MGTMRIIDGTGDTKLIWDVDNDKEVAAAQAMFTKLTKTDKFAAFSVKKNGKKKEQVFSFNKHAEKLIMVPPLQGG